MFGDKWMHANGDDIASAPNTRWFCVHAPNAEPRVATWCANRNVAFFFPLLETLTRQRNAPHVPQLIPLWPGYLFCRLTPARQDQMRTTISVGTLLIPPDERSLLRHLKEYGAINRVQAVLQKGDRITITTGRLEGLEGHVCDGVAAHGNTVRVAVSLMGQSVTLECPVDTIYSSDISYEVKPTVVPRSNTADVGERLQQSLVEVNSELIRYLKQHPHLMHSLAPRAFEQLVAHLLADQGYDVHLTPETRDGGRDILAAFRVPHGELLTIVECKRWAPTRKVGIDIVERFLWTIERNDKASCGLIATTSYFSPEALAKSKEYRWRLFLKDFDALAEWLTQYGTWSLGQRARLWIPDATVGPIAVSADSTEFLG